jgi:hypothetical protein
MHECRFILFIAIKVLQEKRKCNKVRPTGCTQKRETRSARYLNWEL